MDSLYFDAAAGAPLRPDVLEAMLPLLDAPGGNPSSLHAGGRAARRAVEEARESVAQLLGAEPAEIVFTSGATEANNLALRGLADAMPGPPIWAVGATEHPSVLHTAQVLEKEGRLHLTQLRVDATGRVRDDHLRESLQTRGSVLSLMYANNETGVLHPIVATAEWCAQHGILFHCDAVQAVGRLPVNLRELRVDLLSVSAHKIGGPTGVGALYVRRGVRLAPQLTGGGQERKLRAGTANVPGIVGFGAACALARQELNAEHARLERLRDRLQRGLLAARPGTIVHGMLSQRAPHILNLAFPGLDGERLLLVLDSLGVAISTGAACNAGAVTASHVLQAMGVPHALGQSSIRFSLGWHTTDAHVDRLLKLVPEAITQVCRGED